MTIEERLAAVERELAHQEQLRELREINEKLTTARVREVGEQLVETKKVLPNLQSAMKELEEASIVTAHLQARQASILKDHSDWLQSHDRAMTALDDRIEKLVSAIGEMLRTRNGKQ
jgi:hypothetical protein